MSTDLPEDEAEFSMRDWIFIILSSIVILFFLAMSTAPGPLQTVCICLAISEFALTASYICKDRFLLSSHFQYQAIVSSVPFFFLSVSIYNVFYPSGANALLDSFHFVKVKEFIQQAPVLCVNLFGVWTGRMILTYLYLVDVNTSLRLEESKTNDLGPIRQSFCHKVLNLVAFYYFRVMVFLFNSSKVALLLTMIEIIVAMSYDFMHPYVILVHFIFQSAFFSFPLFINWIAVVHHLDPYEALVFISSFGLDRMSPFVTDGPLFFTCFITLVWLVRMLASQVFLIEVATDRRIASRQLRIHPLKLIEYI